MRNLMNKRKLRCTVNEAFADVISGCAATDGRIDEDNAWLGPELLDTWMQLHDEGMAKSVEVWDGDELVGGLYGFVCGRAFIGDSMFSLIPSASKLALIHLARHIQSQGGGIIDCQLETPHLKSMGAEYISYEQYLTYTAEPDHLIWPE
jgi:leucyl/phenylalanyl-tRNA--protein transferase